MYADNGTKFVAIVNRKEPAPRVMNAIGHLMIGLTSSMQSEEVAALHYDNLDAGIASLISHHPFIVLESKNSNQIWTAYQQARAASLKTNLFISQMIGQSAADQVRATAEAKIEDVECIAMALFGAANDVDAVTKRFSLFKRFATADA